MLARQVERIRQSRLIDRIIVATTTAPEDDAIEALARREGCEVFRGSSEDVLGRVVGALRKFDVGLHVEFQGDDPMPDPLLVDAFIGYFLKHADECDYLTNALTTTYPPGAEISVYRAETLIDAERHATNEALREHVGLHVHQHPDRYRIRNLEAPPWLRRPSMHLEVDTQADYELVCAVFEHFYPSNPGFSLSQVIEFLDANPALVAGNRDVERRWRKFRQDEHAES